ncbi:cysteine synthase A [Lachnospiraceae bacterium PM6-15]|uniref:cysteine synthase A n=1 Tax=Ohessyouella blattaphilus TaxID=2949333 RepID=UPI003E283DC0
MSKIKQNVTELVGNTPLMKVNRLIKEEGLKAEILVKLELFNPAGSVKDRIALNMVEEAEKKGTIKAGAVIIEPTSGNTGIGLAAMAAAKGYRAIFTMPETMSIERRKLLAGYGAEIVLTEGKLGMKGAIARAEELASEIPGGIVLGQFENSDNPTAHYRTTGPEIYEATEGSVDVLVAGVGTGGTITGTGTYLKEQKPAVEVVAVEPENSPVLSGGAPGPHKIQGIGAGFVPGVLKTEIIDQIMKISDEDAFAGARLLAQKEGILVGISSGAALSAAIRLAKEDAYKDKVIVVILPDTGERYLSTPLFD